MPSTSALQNKGDIDLKHEPSVVHELFTVRFIAHTKLLRSMGSVGSH